MDAQQFNRELPAVMPVSPSSTNGNLEGPSRRLTVVLRDSGFYPYPDLPRPIDRIRHFKFSLDSRRSPDNAGLRRMRSSPPRLL